MPVKRYYYINIKQQIYIYMGNSIYPKSQFQVLNIPQNTVLREVRSLGYCMLVENPTTSESYQRYGIYTKENKSLEEELRIYEFRKKQDLNLVKVHFVELMDETYFCVGHHQMKVYTQHIQLFLKDLQNIPLQMGLYIIQAALIGFHVIYDNFGYINLNDSLFGINGEKKIRVWLNSNFALNSCESQLNLSQGRETNEEQVMVEEIFQTIQYHISQSNLLLKFKNQRILNKKNMNFLQAQEFIKSFARNYKIPIPSKISFSKEKKNLTMNNNNKSFDNPHVQLHRPVRQQLKQSLLFQDHNKKILIKNRTQCVSNLNRVNLNISNGYFSNPITYLNPRSKPALYNKPVVSVQTPTKLKAIYMTQQKNPQIIRSQTNLFARSQIQNKQSSQIFIKKPSSFINSSIKTLNRVPHKTHLLDSYLIHNQKSVQASTIAQKTNNKNIVSLSNLHYGQEFACSIENTEINLISKNGSQKDIDERRRKEIEQAEKYFQSLEKTLQIQDHKPNLNRYVMSMEYNDVDRRDINSIEINNPAQEYKMNKKDKIAQIIANAKLFNANNKQSSYHNTEKKDTPSEHFQEHEEDEQKFFKANFLDYQKYKQILKEGNNGELKQSITFEQLGNNIPTPTRQHNYQGIKLQKLQKLTKRRQISKSMTPDDQFLYPPLLSQRQSKPFPKEINQSMQLHEGSFMDA